jgi:hypothetical protein
MSYTFGGIAELIKRMEFELGLLKDETYGRDARHVWEASRSKLQSYLNVQLSLQEQTHEAPDRIRQMSLFNLISYICRFLYSVAVKNWIWAPRGREWLIFRFPRRRKYYLGGYEDIYTDDLIDEIGYKHCVVIDKPYLRRHYVPQRHSSFHIEMVYLISRICKYIKPYYDSIPMDKMIDRIQSYLEEKYIYIEEINIKNIITYKRFFADYISYLYMLKWLRPKKVLLLVSYFQAPLVLAASTLQIPTVELQHGVIASEHLGYSMSIGMKKRTFPDYLLLFGNYWKQSVDNMPLPPERLIVFGYPYFERVSKKNSSMTRMKNNIVLISQRAIGKELSQFAVRLAVLKKDSYKIFFKLHPGERNRARKIYPELYEAQRQGLLEVVDTDTPALYTLFAQSYWQIGVYSTALFEGIALGCQTILVDLPGIEYMEPLVKRGYAQLVGKPEEILFDKENNMIQAELFAQDWRSNWKKFDDMDLQCRVRGEVA